jgi:hypothetical protein
MATKTSGSAIVQRIVQRLVQARAKNKLEDLLEKTKNDKKLPREAFRVSGTAEQVDAAIVTAVNDGHLSIRELADLVDQVEENGAQHIFLFRLNDEGRAAITEDSLRKRFLAYPTDPTEELYAELPAQSRTYFRQDANVSVVKQISKTSYWEVDRDESKETADLIVRVTRRKEKRVIHLARFDREGNVEIRIDRLMQSTTDTRAVADFEEFADSLNPPLKWQEHLEPVPIWNGFNDIVRATAETFMNIDEAADGSVRQRFSSSRAEMRGTDVRKHKDWKLSTDDYHRTGLNVYWLYGHGESQEKIYTSLAAVTVRDMLLAKVFVSAKVDPGQLNHVITRVRHFAGQSSR